jgi:hypothetical protein
MRRRELMGREDETSGLKLSIATILVRLSHKIE